MCKFVGKIKQIIPFKGEIEKIDSYVGEFIKNYKSPIYDNELPIEWNTVEIANAGNKMYPYAPANRLKISSLVPTRNELANMKITLSYIRSDGTEAEYEFVCPYENIKWNDKQYVVATFENTEYNLKEYFTVVPKDEPIPHGLYWYTNNFSANDVTKGGWNYKLYVPDIPTDIYNGVELPDIETVWTDKETYPYAVIVSHPNGDYSLVLQSFEMYVQRYNNGGETLVTERNSGVLYAYSGGFNWTYNGEMNYNLMLIAYDTGEVHGTPHWASYDLKYVVDEPVEPDIPDTPTGIYDDEWPIEWNSLAVVEEGNVMGTIRGATTADLPKVSNLVPTADELISMQGVLTIGSNTYDLANNGELVDLAGLTTAMLFSTGVADTDGTNRMFVVSLIPIESEHETTLDGDTMYLPEAGLYVWIQNYTNYTDYDISLTLPVTATHYLYGREADSVVSYNGVTLPDIESVWTDKETYPYAYMYPNGGDYYLELTSLPMTYDSNLKFAVGVNFKAYYYKSTFTAWKSGSSGTLAEGGNNYATPLWSNHDILNSDGTTYLAASDPVKSYTDPDVFIGDVGYKGAVLPNIDELLTDEQKAKYPFKWIYKAGKRYRMYALPTVEVHYSNAVHWFGVWGDDASYITALYTDGQWGEVEEITGGTNTFVQAEMWKNFDIVYEGETLSVASPAPIPVGDPIGYSYNGTVLPVLPEWDKTVYPYAVMSFITYDYESPPRTVGFLYLLDNNEQDYYEPYGGGANRWGILLPNGYMTANATSGDTGWSDFEAKSNLSNALQVNQFEWANFDLLNEDGTIYIAASDPIPVYE